MSVVESLPARPLEPEELLRLNAVEALELAVPIEDEGRASRGVYSRRIPLLHPSFIRYKATNLKLY